MITVKDAIEIVHRESLPLGNEIVDLVGSVGRTLAEPIVADSDMPPFDRSQMDGFAVRAEDTIDAPVTLKLVGESAAGRGWHHTLGPGQAVAIMTGAPLPPGSDAVQKIELTDSEFGKSSQVESFITLREPTEAGRYIVKMGSEVKCGGTIFQPGTRITESMIATLAAFGYAKVLVGRKPRVTILSTGSELVSIEVKPGQDQIRNSNSVMLAVMAARCGAAPNVEQNIADELSLLAEQISHAARSSDVLILTGGVSVGKYDLTKSAIEALGADIYFEKVRLKPGKPAVFGRLDKTLVFGLPGNPVSAAVTFHLFVRYALELLQGRSNAEPRKGFGILQADVKAARERDTYLPAATSSNESGNLIVSPLRWHGSSDFIGFADADALIVAERGNHYQKGNAVRIEYL